MMGYPGPIGAIEDLLEYTELERESLGVKALTLRAGRVFSHHGVIIDAENRLVLPLCRDLGAEGKEGPSKVHRVMNRPSLPDPVWLDGRVVVLCAPSSWKNYYHWMREVVPRMRGIDWEKISAVLVPLGKPFHADCLRAARVPEEKWLPLGAEDHFEAEELIFPLGSGLGVFGKEEMAELREMFLPGGAALVAQERSLALYLRRGRGTWRRQVANEEALITALEAEGIEAVDLMDCSVREQAALMARACLVVAPHGAALCNLIFASSGCRVLECFSGAYHRDYFEEIAKVMELDYHAHVTKPGVGEDGGTSWPLAISEIVERSRALRV